MWHPPLARALVPCLLLAYSILHEHNHFSAERLFGTTVHYPSATHHQKPQLKAGRPLLLLGGEHRQDDSQGHRHGQGGP